MASVSACAGVSGGVRGRARSRRAATSASGCDDEHPTTGQLAHHEATALELVMLSQPLEPGHDLVELGAGGVGQGFGGHRVAGEEEQGLECALELGAGGAHALSLACAAVWAAWIVISPNGSSWFHVSSPCL